MADEIPDLWPAEATVTEAFTPLAILRHQAGQLRRKTKNMLEAEVISEEQGSPDQPGTDVIHHLEIVAPALDRYRIRLVSFRHRKRLVYPVRIIDDEQDDERAWLDDQKQFLDFLGRTLRAPHVVSVIQSLIAQSNEIQRREAPEDTRAAAPATA